MEMTPDEHVQLAIEFEREFNILCFSHYRGVSDPVRYERACTTLGDLMGRIGPREFEKVALAWEEPVKGLMP